MGFTHGKEEGILDRLFFNQSNVNILDHFLLSLI